MVSNKKALRAVTLGLCMATLVATPALAKYGPDDWYSSYEEKSRYKVGDDIEPGKYMFFNKSDTKNASISIKRDGEVIWSDTFWHNYIIDVEDGDTVSAVSAYCVEYDDLEPWSVVACEEGFFEVGKHLDPGVYDVEYIRGSDDGDCFVRIWSDLIYADNKDYKRYQEEQSMSRGKSIEIRESLLDGWYIQLSGCRLVPHTGK